MNPTATVPTPDLETVLGLLSTHATRLRTNEAPAGVASVSEPRS